MAITDYPLAIPQGSRILVSGANGFIASHIIKQFLEAGYKVPPLPPLPHNET
jgi:nucleoside-diphosphate-sugar epimerase